MCNNQTLEMFTRLIKNNEFPFEIRKGFLNRRIIWLFGNILPTIKFEYKFIVPITNFHLPKYLPKYKR